MGMLPLNEAALIAMVLVCAVTDLRTGRIYNAVTYPAMLCGVALAAAGQSGTIAGSVAGLVIGALPLYAFFAAGMMGGGDVKLMGAVGAMAGVPFVLDAMFYSVFLAGLCAAVVLVWRGHARALAGDIRHAVRQRGNAGVTLVARGGSFPFGAAIAAGTLTALALGRAG